MRFGAIHMLSSALPQTVSLPKAVAALALGYDGTDWMSRMLCDHAATATRLLSYHERCTNVRV